MTLYSLISSGLSYVFTTIIYLFIFSVIRLIYMDIRKTNGTENKKAEAERSAEKSYSPKRIQNNANVAVLKTIKTKEAAALKLRNEYVIESFAVLGRAEDCEIHINDKYLSLDHFRIWFENGEWCLSDLKSRNGTYVNDIRIKRPVVLEDGDEITAGGVAFIFRSDF